MKYVLVLMGFLVIAPALAQAPVPTQTPQTQITTTAPVNAPTTISVGTIGGEILNWVLSALGVTIGTVITAVAMKILKKLGLETTDIQKAQLQAIIVNGLNAAGARAADELKGMGMGKIEIKNAIVADAVKYTQAHAGETIRALGLDPQSGAAVQAIKARIETALTDPSTPTPAAITPPAAQAAKV